MTTGGRHQIYNRTRDGLIRTFSGLFDYFGNKTCFFRTPEGK